MRARNTLQAFVQITQQGILLLQNSRQ
uniref:Uncharacterized protein n=1 Tax=Rhizophora mucronata TaxID=61149 RepID=A0A2P2JQG1_RHIMU